MAEVAVPRLDPRIVADLRREHLIKEGHWVFEYGGHSNGLIDRDHLLSDPVAASHMAYAIAKQYFTDHIETVATPSIWGAGLALLVGGFLDPKAKIAYATPSADGPTIAPQIEDLVRGKRVLLVDNLIRSGETIAHFMKLIEDLGGEAVGVATLWNLSEPTLEGHEVFGLLNIDYPVFRDGACPVCAAGSSPEPAPY
jgi:adenine/guanine phosphoribosyltransferase-like PRPP-binding protein